MKTLIHATELWVPSDDGLLLEFGGGFFRSVTLEGISRAMCFGRAEGLPGQAWDEGRPILLPRFEGSNFRRTAAARAAGLGCAVAVPTFDGERLTSVLVFFCGDDAAERGAVELWRNDPRVTTDMTLLVGRYGAQAGALEALSRETFLPRGSGLPGLAWQRGRAVFMPDLPGSARFLRGEAATGAGLMRGLAIPCAARADTHQVLTFLAPVETPIALRIERWRPDDARARLVLEEGHCEVTGPLASGADTVPLAPAGGALARAWATGVPALTPQAVAEPGPAGAAATACRADAMLALPISAEGEVAEVLALYF